jgi:hypothetical protein
LNAASGLIFVVMTGLVLSMAGACSEPVRKTGFLSDYSRLIPDKGNLRYTKMRKLGTYDRFIIEPVKVHLHGIPQGARPEPAIRTELANYLHNAIVNAIEDRYMIVSQPGPGVARIRVAITDIQRSTPSLNFLPQTKLTGIGLGGASMEGEVLDSQTGEQIGAVIRSQKGKSVSMSGMKEWGDAKAVLDDWAARFRRHLDISHGG